MAENSAPKFVTVSFALGLVILLCGFFMKSWVDDVNADRKMAKQTQDRVLVLETQYTYISGQLMVANQKLDQLLNGKTR